MTVKVLKKEIINIFEQKFKLRKDIGNEYFEGDYKIMINIIFFTINNESFNETSNKKYICQDTISNEKPIYQNIIYDDWVKQNY